MDMGMVELVARGWDSQGPGVTVAWGTGALGQPVLGTSRDLTFSQ